jgi:hypothetical protein
MLVGMCGMVNVSLGVDCSWQCVIITVRPQYGMADTRVIYNVTMLHTVVLFLPVWAIMRKRRVEGSSHQLGCGGCCLKMLHGEWGQHRWRLCVVTARCSQVMNTILQPVRMSFHLLCVDVSSIIDANQNTLCHCNGYRCILPIAGHVSLRACVRM